LYTVVIIQLNLYAKLGLRQISVKSTFGWSPVLNLVLINLIYSS
jgi:hypothetical protein